MIFAHYLLRTHDSDVHSGEADSIAEHHLRCTVRNNTRLSEAAYRKPYLIGVPLPTASHSSVHIVILGCICSRSQSFEWSWLWCDFQCGVERKLTEDRSIRRLQTHSTENGAVTVEICKRSIGDSHKSFQDTLTPAQWIGDSREKWFTRHPGHRLSRTANVLPR